MRRIEFSGKIGLPDPDLPRLCRATGPPSKAGFVVSGPWKLPRSLRRDSPHQAQTRPNFRGLQAIRQRLSGNTLNERIGEGQWPYFYTSSTCSIIKGGDSPEILGGDSRENFPERRPCRAAVQEPGEIADVDSTGGNCPIPPRCRPGGYPPPHPPGRENFGWECPRRTWPERSDGGGGASTRAVEAPSPLEVDAKGRLEGGLGPIGRRRSLMVGLAARAAGACRRPGRRPRAQSPRRGCRSPPPASAARGPGIYVWITDSRRLPSVPRKDRLF